MKKIKKYLFPIIAILILAVIFIISKDLGIQSALIVGHSFKEMAMVLPPIFILLGLLDVWVSRERMIKIMGHGSGVKGVIIAIIMGSVTAGPLYIAFPIAAMLTKKGAKLSNILIFLGAWSTAKIPMVLFEISALGIKFAFTRIVISLIGIIITAYAICSILSQEEKDNIYAKAIKNIEK